MNIHEQLDLAHYWGPLHKHATTPIPKEPGLDEVHGQSPTPTFPRAAPQPPKPKPIPEIALTHSLDENSGLQLLFPAHRSCGLLQRRSLALGRFVRAPAAERYLAQ